MSYSDRFGSQLNVPISPQAYAKAHREVGGKLTPNWRDALEQVTLAEVAGQLDSLQASMLRRLIRDGYVRLALYSLANTNVLKQAA